MKLRELKDKIDKVKESDLDNDVMVEVGNEKYHVFIAKSTNYNKRDGKFTPRIFEIFCKS